MRATKKFLFLIFFLGLIWLTYSYFFAIRREIVFAEPKTVSLNDNGLIFSVATEAVTVAELLEGTAILVGEHDQLTPESGAPVFPGTNITISRAAKIKIEADGKTTEAWTLQKNIELALNENGITLGRLDKVSPEKIDRPRNDDNIIVTRINVEEKVIAEDIDFKIEYNNDSKLGWREEKITQQGELGTREVKYKITYKNGQEISRIPLEKNIVKSPVSQIVTKGTHMELGKAAKGQGTWYAFKGGLFAASTSLPRGSYAKVTNTANGKSVVVQINDYGPFGKGRIIDLDKVAFQKIASLGAGVIGVKVEPILN